MEVFKKVSLILLVSLAAAFLVHSVAYGFDGKLTMDISLKPQTTLSEAGLIDFDFESSLQLDIAISGMTLSSDIGFGIAGIEFSIFGLEATLGGLDMDDRFIFAAPFNKNGLALGGSGPSLLFVKKRVELEMYMAGLRVNNLVIFKDVNFPDPSSSLRTSFYSTSDQTFHFGDVLTVEGTTVGGISVRGIIGACADHQRYNRIKKRAFRGRACIHEGLEGFVEKIIIEKISLFQTYWESETVFRPLEPIEEMITGKFNLLGLVDLELELSTTDITTLSFDLITLQVASDWIAFVSEWHSEFDETWYWVEVPISYGGLDLDYQIAFIEGQGLTDLLLEGTIQLGPYPSLGITTVFTNGPPLEWELAEFSLKSEVGSLELKAEALFTTVALREAKFGLEIGF